MRSIARVVDVSFNSIVKLLVDAEIACAGYHDATVRNVPVNRVQHTTDGQSAYLNAPAPKKRGSYKKRISN